MLRSISLYCVSVTVGRLLYRNVLPEGEMMGGALIFLTFTYNYITLLNGKNLGGGGGISRGPSICKEPPVCISVPVTVDVSL